MGKSRLPQQKQKPAKAQQAADDRSKTKQTAERQYDYLTGLPSMTYFFELSDAEKDRILKEGGLPVMLYIDFRGMKFFNSRHGFAEGNNMLQTFAGLISRLFGKNKCCRIGADHFAVGIEGTGLEEKLKELFREFGERYDGRTPPVHVGIYPQSFEDVPASVACDRAKFACNALKGSYYSDFNYFSAELREDEILKQYFVENLDTAIEEKWIQVYLQPIIRAVNGQVCDAEALARWVDPEKGIMSPGSFIPALEEAGLIQKLDLYMVDQVLESIKTRSDDGATIVPHSINLSRADFDACDIVEEIRKRVDASGVPRDRITIEVTESLIGSDFEFMKKQIERFQSLGFPVWLDDFGSMYSSLDVLQSIKFDLLKFDMSFMRKLDEGENAKIIMTELMRMANALGLDTVCEGVETEEQIRFLQEIGCSKLQGYFYSCPVSFETLRKQARNNTLIKSENPDESEYYESIGRANLNDLGIVASGQDNALKHTYSTIPIAIVEINEDSARYIRSNQSYQHFAKRYFGHDVLNDQVGSGDSGVAYSSSFVASVKQCCNSTVPVFFDERLQDGSTSHFYARRLSVNPVTGSAAVAIAILSIKEPDENTSYADIAKALAADYYNIFVIDMDTNDYIEYSSMVGAEELSIVRRGVDFFESARRDTMTRIYEEDREPFLALFTKENVLRDLDRQGVFTTTYRLIDTGDPMYVNMKITRLAGGNRIILGISIIDAQMKERERARKLRREKNALGRIAALSPDYIVLYTIDPETGHYTQYSPSSDFAQFGLESQGDDFFGAVVTDAPIAIHPEDIDRHLRVMTKENILGDIQRKGYFTHEYRMIMAGNVVQSMLKATMVEENGIQRIILGVTSDDNERAYEKAKNAVTIYTHLAHALARGYSELFYVNMETNELIEFNTDDKSGVLSQARQSVDFFEGCERDAKLFVHPEDQEKFVQAMNREFLEDALSETGTFEMTYRRMIEGRPVYVQMDVSRMEDDERIIVIAVSDIDELMHKRREEERIKEERQIYARLHAITGNFICVYVVDPKNGHYHEFSATSDYEQSFSQAKEGTDFFGTLRSAAAVFSHPDDRERVLSVLNQDNVIEAIENSGIFTLEYRIMKDDYPLYIQLKAAMVEEEDGPRLIVGLNDIDKQVRHEQAVKQRLEHAQSQAKIDALTGIKNRHAFLEFESRIDSQISADMQPPFAIVVLDVNDLKKVNDTSGHQMGDQYIRDACKIICNIFKHSPVFRVGGDEFAVIAQGQDYDSIEELLGEVAEQNVQAAQSGGVVIACGMAKYDSDECVSAVFKRADNMMYQNKNEMKPED